MIAKAKSNYYECFFNFKKAAEAYELIERQKFVLVNDTKLFYEILERPYYFGDGSKVTYPLKPS